MTGASSASRSTLVFVYFGDGMPTVRVVRDELFGKLGRVYTDDEVKSGIESDDVGVSRRGGGGSELKTFGSKLEKLAAPGVRRFASPRGTEEKCRRPPPPHGPRPPPEHTTLRRTALQHLHSGEGGQGCGRLGRRACVCRCCCC